MSASYDIQPESHLLTQTYSGSVSFGDVVALIQRIWEDPRYQIDYDVVVDLAEATLAMTPGEIQSLCDMLMDSSQASQGRTSIIVTGFMETALTMIFRKRMSPTISIGIFSTYNGAYSFLGRDVLPSSIDP